jgi:UDP-N-acetylglucosamine--N-acetylmuramyl-(pentapeptide) pyrophosphoryl-undecaprenol N-acetylglucosamine transferase
VPKTEIAFLGGDRFEAEAVPGAGYSFRAFPLARLRSWSSLRNLTIPLVVRRSAASMTDHLRERGAKVVVGMGGYVSVPASIAARRAGVPFFLQEQNATPGRASRFAARRAVATFLGLPGESERLPRSTVVGNPLRPELATADRYALRPDARRRYGLGGSGRVLGILGGSLGARVLNDAAPALVVGSGAVGIVHLTGAGAHAAMVQLASDAAVPWTCRPFEAEMQYFYAAADLVVCRAGATTIAELTAAGRPALLVPLPTAADDHQRRNAEVLAAGGAAEIVEQRILTGALLAERIAALIGDPARLAAMSAAARRMSRPNAAGVIVDKGLSLVGKS